MPERRAARVASPAADDGALPALGRDTDTRGVRIHTERTMNHEDPKVVETNEANDNDETSERRLTVEVPTDVQAGIIGKGGPVCTCPPGCCC